ncbi:hypothetical protein [Turneriella parva]|uniref:hypothetical protein n=1 Tax=Turneriella parva TaxID=29510 RepID=UPI0005A50D3C|nr:hypothetical protein [Turneriella parva]
MSTIRADALTLAYAVTCSRVWRISLVLVLVVLLLASCSSAPKRDDMTRLNVLAEERTGSGVRWRTNETADSEIRKKVRTLLARELSVADAVKVALLNNPGLQAEFDRLGAAVADVWQAGLLKNPTLALSPRLSTKSGNPTIESGIDLNLLDYFMRSALCAQAHRRSRSA